jgi:hypothetical protein
MKNKGIQVIDNSNEGTVLDLKINPVRDSNGRIVSGLVIGETLEQNMGLILMSHMGDFKFKPDLGVGLGDIVLSTEFPEFRSKIRSHFIKDKLKVTELELYTDKPFKINAEYE